MSLPPPSASDRYQLTGILYRWTVALWNSVFGSIADRLNALEEREADYQEVIDAGTGAAIDYVQNAVAPQIEQIGDTIAGLNADISDAQDILAALQSQGVPASNVPVSPAGNFPDGTSVQEALEALDQVTEGIGDALTSHKTGVDVHAEARATTALGRAGTDNSRIMTPYLVRDARLLRTNLQSGAYTVLPADFGQTISCSSTFTLALTAAATLGDGWYCYVRNTGSGVITIDPNGAETIDGAATMTVRPGDVLMVHCNGTAFRTFGRGSTRALTDVTSIVAASAAIDLTVGYDGSWDELIYRFIGVKGSGGLYLIGRQASNSVWNPALFTGLYGYYNGGPSGNGTIGADMNVSINANNPGAMFDIRIRNPNGAAPRAEVAGLLYSSSFYNGYANLVSSQAINGIRISAYSNSFSSGTYQVLGVKYQ